MHDDDHDGQPSDAADATSSSTEEAVRQGDDVHEDDSTTGVGTDVPSVPTGADDASERPERTAPRSTPSRARKPPRTAAERSAAAKKAAATRAANARARAEAAAVAAAAAQAATPDGEPSGVADDDATTSASAPGSAPSAVSAGGPVEVEVGSDDRVGTETASATEPGSTDEDAVRAAPSTGPVALDDAGGTRTAAEGTPAPDPAVYAVADTGATPDDDATAEHGPDRVEGPTEPLRGASPAAAPATSGTAHGRGLLGRVRAAVDRAVASSRPGATAPRPLVEPPLASSADGLGAADPTDRLTDVAAEVGEEGVAPGSDEEVAGAAGRSTDGDVPAAADTETETKTDTDSRADAAAAPEPEPEILTGTGTETEPAPEPVPAPAAVAPPVVAPRPAPRAPAADAPVVLSIAGLVKRYGSTTAVEGVDLEVRAGSFTGIVGPNGAGKTTTLSIVTGLLRPDAGTVTVLGADVWADPAAAKRSLGVLPDRLRLFDRLTGAQLLYYSATLRGLDGATARKRSSDLAVAFGLQDALGRLVSDYSVGMTKKIALAAAIIHSPRVLVLDEPFESVDPVSAATVTDVLQRYVAGGGTVLLSSHSMDLVERICDSVAVIVDGHVLASGPVDEVREGRSLEERFVELAGGRAVTEGMEWLQNFSD